MEKFLTKGELEYYLYRIRNTLCGYDYGQLRNVIFFNSEAVFEYLCDIPLDGGENGAIRTVGDALNAVSAFIPVNLGDNSLKFLMAAGPSDFPGLLEAEFEKRSKMEFLEILTQISNSAEWACLMNLCETIRLFREKEETAVLR